MLDLVKILHLFIIYLVIIQPFRTNNRYILYFIIILNYIIVYTWYLHGDCILTTIENKLDKNNKSISNLLNDKIGIDTKYITLTPLLSLIISLYQLNKLFC
jgi:hypothetical protein